MTTERRPTIVLVGFSATGKSTVGQRLATRLGWACLDTDALVEELAGKPVPAIFAQEGEARFRELEQQAVAAAVERGPAVISTGGGVVLRAENWASLRRHGPVILLEASPATVLARLRAHPDDVARPLLAGDNPRARIEWLKEYRQPYYARADWTIHTDRLSPDEVAAEAERAWRLLSDRPAGAETARDDGDLFRKPASETRAPYCADQGAALIVQTETARYPIYAGHGILADLGGRLRNLGWQGRVSLVSDEQVYAAWGAATAASLREARLEVASYTVPAGETSKSLATAERLYDWLVGQRVERGQPLIALGGGVVGDLAGYIAATYLRGLPYVQVPTSLLAMVDSSVGGKVAVNHPRGKNLIGAFYHPQLVLMDVATLGTLPPRELTSGWAEVIKHGLILDAAYFARLEDEADAILAGEPRAVSEVVQRSAQIKAEVVGQDERESGLRMILNCGHTVGHALEAVTNYESYLHGEAVAIGLAACARLSADLGLFAGDDLERLERLLQRYGLPIRATGVGVPASGSEPILAATALDKKVKGKKVRWILPTAIGRVTVRDDVPAEAVRRAVEAVLR